MTSGTTAIVISTFIVVVTLLTQNVHTACFSNYILTNYTGGYDYNTQNVCPIGYAPSKLQKCEPYDTLYLKYYGLLCSSTSDCVLNSLTCDLGGISTGVCIPKTLKKVGDICKTTTECYKSVCTNGKCSDYKVVYNPAGSVCAQQDQTNGYDYQCAAGLSCVKGTCFAVITSKAGETCRDTGFTTYKCVAGTQCSSNVCKNTIIGNVGDRCDTTDNNNIYTCNSKAICRNGLCTAKLNGDKGDSCNSGFYSSCKTPYTCTSGVCTENVEVALAQTCSPQGGYDSNYNVLTCSSGNKFCNDSNICSQRILVNQGQTCNVYDGSNYYDCSGTNSYCSKITSTCKTIAKLGQVCEPSALIPCESTYTCRNPKFNATEPVCMDLSDKDQYCENNDHCTRGTSCLSVSNKCSYLNGLPNGEQCKLSFQCDSGYCSPTSGVCTVDTSVEQCVNSACDGSTYKGKCTCYGATRDDTINGICVTFRRCDKFKSGIVNCMRNQRYPGSLTGNEVYDDSNSYMKACAKAFSLYKTCERKTLEFGSITPYVTLKGLDLNIDLNVDPTVVYTCYGTVATDGNVCSGRGRCTGWNKCECNAPFSGEMCDAGNIFPQSSTAQPVAASQRLNSSVVVSFSNLMIVMVLMMIALFF